MGLTVWHAVSPRTISFNHNIDYNRKCSSLFEVYAGWIKIDSKKTPAGLSSWHDICDMMVVHITIRDEEEKNWKKDLANEPSLVFSVHICICEITLSWLLGCLQNVLLRGVIAAHIYFLQLCDHGAVHRWRPALWSVSLAGVPNRGVQPLESHRLYSGSHTHQGQVVGGHWCFRR